MQEERMQVLKMVDEGKITVDEATKLLEGLRATGNEGGGKQFEEKFKAFTNDMKEFCKDVTCKLNEATKKAEPKVKEFAKNVVAKTADIADNISQSLNEKVKNMNGECCGEEGCGCGSDEQPADNGPRPEEKEELKK
ncbi:MAG: hypothetical protein FWE34_01715 [Defluviitaleaceae bacterium]|nr:hypothetical protein [Defluviitaleaceae bacterium]